MDIDGANAVLEEGEVGEKAEEIARVIRESVF